MTAAASSGSHAEEAMRMMKLQHNLRTKNRISVVQTFIGLVSPLFLAGIALLASMILLDPTAYPSFTVDMAATAIFVDSLGFIGSVWTVFLRKGRLQSAFIDS